MLKTFDDVVSARAEILAYAIGDTNRYCGAPQQLVWDRKTFKHSDQFWMDILTIGRPWRFDAVEAHRFLVEFMLTNRVQWDKDRFSDEVGNFVARQPYDPIAMVTDLAEALRACNARNTRQTSAASKIAMFAKPTTQIFIWDSLAAMSARARQWDLGGRQTVRPKTSVFTTPEADHDYAAHHTACLAALIEERSRKDFRDAVDVVTAHVDQEGGPMADRSRTPLEFIERRFLDKLMFAEGHFMKYGAIPTVAGGVAFFNRPDVRPVPQQNHPMPLGVA